MCIRSFYPFFFKKKKVILYNILFYHKMTKYVLCHLPWKRYKHCVKISIIEIFTLEYTLSPCFHLRRRFGDDDHTNHGDISNKGDKHHFSINYTQIQSLMTLGPKCDINFTHLKMNTWIIFVNPWINARLNVIHLTTIIFSFQINSNKNYRYWQG